MTLIGKKFGKLKVVGKGTLDKRGHVKWVCVCECGNSKEILGYNLKARGSKASCGCGHKDAVRKYIPEGSRFGRLKVLRFSRTIGGRTAYMCQCDCGNETEVKREKLVSKWTRSCGCIVKESLGGNFLKTHGLSKTGAYNRMSAARSRHRRLGLNGSVFSTQDVLKIIKEQKFFCFYCQVSLKEDYHLDHKIPLSKEGLDEKENICATCPTCNLRKGNKTDRQFLKIIKEWIGVDERKCDTKSAQG